jgi:nucleotide-binding universal stress UspA family protein
MPSLAHILLPVDFSERSSGAARCVRSLASRFGSAITVLHVLPPPQYEFGAMDVSGSVISEIYLNRASLAARDLDAFIAAEFSGVQASAVVLEGDAAGKIVEYAHSHAADLILMPTHGYGPFRRFILGSNTAKVLHDADCPVWTGIHMADAPAPPVPLQHVLCAVDLGANSRRTLDWAVWLSCAFGARLTLMHAAPACPEEAPALADAARQELVRLQKDAGASADLLIESGDPATVICAAAERLKANVMVIGRGSAAGVFGRLRTNAYAIIRQSPCPVASV